MKDIITGILLGLTTSAVSMICILIYTNHSVKKIATKRIAYANSFNFHCGDLNRVVYVGTEDDHNSECEFQAVIPLIELSETSRISLVEGDAT